MTDPTTDVPVVTITITRVIDPNGDLADDLHVDGHGDRVPLTTVLGMMRLAEDTAIRSAMSEAPRDGEL